MKKIVFTAAMALMAAITFAQKADTAQYKQHHGKRGVHERHHRGESFKKLNLSESQQTQLKSINADFRKQMADLNKQENITVKEQRDKRAALAKAHKAKIDGVFTTEQKAQLTQMRVEGKKRAQEFRAKHFEQMKADLNLTEEQAAKLKASHESIAAKMKSIHENTSLDREAKRAQIKALHEEMKASTDKLLTVEQQEKLKALHEQRRGKMMEHKERFIKRDAVK